MSDIDIRSGVKAHKAHKATWHDEVLTLPLKEAEEAEIHGSL